MGCIFLAYYFCIFPRPSFLKIPDWRGCPSPHHPPAPPAPPPWTYKPEGVDQFYPCYSGGTGPTSCDMNSPTNLPSQSEVTGCVDSCLKQCEGDHRCLAFNYNTNKGPTGSCYFFYPETPNNCANYENDQCCMQNNCYGTYTMKDREANVNFDGCWKDPDTYTCDTQGCT